MDNDKPSNPSGGSGSSDDLIEEMARLMASDAQEAKPAAPSPASSSTPAETSSEERSTEPHTPSGSSSSSPSSGDEGDTSSPSWLPRQPQSERPAPAVTPSTAAEPEPTAARAAPEPVAVPRDPTPSSHSAPSLDSGPGWLPPRARPEPARREPSFTPEPPAAEVPPAEPPAERAPFDFGLDRPSEAAPASTEPEPSEESTPGFDFDFGFGEAPAGGLHQESEPEPEPEPEPLFPRAEPVSRPTSPPVEQNTQPDPIADLIRQQVEEPQAPAAPEPVARAPQEPAEPPQSDNFSVSPVFGLGGETKRSTSGSDAFGDIEALIGNAAHVEMPADQPSPPPPPAEPQRPAAPAREAAPVPQPPVRPNQPRPAPQQPSQNVDAAEAAILAAMASTGGREPASAPQPDPQPMRMDTGGFDSDFGDEAPVMAEGREQRSPIKWGNIITLVAALLILVAFGTAGYRFLTATPPEGEAPVLLADGDPAKETPEAEATDGTGDAVVFSGDASGDGSDEQLVSRDQSETDGDDPIRQIITADTSENGLANRKVRTVTVRPDGTIIRGDDIVAGSEALPVDRPEVPELPADAVTSDLADTEVSGLDLNQASAFADGLTTANPANLVEVNGSSVPFPASPPANLAALRSAAPASNLAPPASQPLANDTVVTTPAPTIVTQPVEQPAAVDLLGDLQQSPTVEQPQEATPVTAPSVDVTSAAAWVQLASHRDEAIANSEAGRLSRLYSSALSGRDVTVQRADLGDRGIWYRILVPATSLPEAQSMCVQIQNIGGDCIPRGN